LVNNEKKMAGIYFHPPFFTFLTFYLIFYQALA